MERKNKRQLGAEKELLAAEYLKTRGFRILEKNFFCHQGEIDLIALSPEQELVFVEVKYRTDSRNGFPEEAVNGKKQARLRKASQVYLYQHPCSMSLPCRYDVISILGEEIRQIENAFDFR